VLDIADQCLKLSRISAQDHYDPPTDTLVIIRYLNAVFNFMTGRKGAWGELSQYAILIQIVAALGESIRLALFLGMHREATYSCLGAYLFSPC
jgi:hypothetical protein